MEEIRKVGSTKWIPRGASLTPKTPLYYIKDDADEKYPITAYLPSNPRDIQYRYWALGDNKTKGTFEWHKAFPRSSPFSLVNVKSLGEIEERAEYWERCQKALYEATDGDIDLSKYTSFKQAALYLWRESCLQYDPEHIDDEEAEWLLCAKNGMTIWWKGERYEGYGVQQDMNSFYLTLMCQPEFQIPMKKPIFHIYNEDHFDHEGNSAKCGIYRAQIEGDSFLFNHQVNNHYTNFDIMCARQRGLKISMIQDDKPNAMVYETGKAAGSHMFKEFADRMQDLKKQGVLGAKDLMRSFWGGFGQKNKKRLNGKPNKAFECYQDKEISKIVDIDDGEKNFTLHVHQKTNPFLTPFARLSIFLPALGRFVMANILHEHQDKILRVYCDSWISTERLDIDAFTEGIELGQFKTEHQGKVVIESAKTVHW